MRVLQDFVAAIEQWISPLSGHPLEFSRPPSQADLRLRPTPPSPLSSSQDLSPACTTGVRSVRLAPCRAIKRQRQIRHPRLALVLTTLTFTAVLGQRFYNQPELQVGSVASETIYAPETASVEDRATTEEQRRDARNGALRMLKVDAATNESILRSLTALMTQLSILRREAGTFPFVDTGTLSTETQADLRRSSDADWLKVRSLISPLVDRDTSPGNWRALTLEALTQGQTLTPAQERAIRELWAYAQRASTQEFMNLLAQVEQSRQSYQQAEANFRLLASQSEGVAHSPELFTLSPQEWTNTQIGLRRVTERMLAQGISPGVPNDLLQRAVQVQLRGSVPRNAEELAGRLLLAELQPNLVEDSDRTRLQAEMAADAVKPVYVDVREGEVIVASGETITQSNFVLLDHFNLSKRRFNYWGLALFGGLVGGGVGVFLVVERLSSHNLRQQDYVLLTSMVVGTGVLKIFGLAAYGLPAVGLLAGNFYGPLVGGTLIVLLMALLPLGATSTTLSFVAAAAGGLVCSLLAGRMRSREELALLGGGVGLTQGVVYLLLTVVFSPVGLLSAWTGILTGAAIQGMYGVFSSIAALGLSPYLEHAFDLITPIRLAELSNPNRPLLKRLASEAPGTFQHTLFVATLAEAAARALGCNVELVRAGTLYHDIGKMHDPLGFIENQMGGPNKHDQLNDPWLSASIIKRHVTEGVVMARKHRLPEALQAFIPEHQGTMLISYFHHQAQEMAKADPSIEVKEVDFRYDGPAPQSPETGIVMLADSCEAALRSLTDATPEEALAMVNRILRARWKENQLVDSGLTREHMTVIADIFVQVWQQYNHKRIAYPKAAVTPKLG